MKKFLSIFVVLFLLLCASPVQAGILDGGMGLLGLPDGVSGDYQPLDADLTKMAGADTWMMYFKNGVAAMVSLPISDANKFLMSNGTAAAPTWESITDAIIVFTDVTTGNADTTKHGYRAKLTNVAYSYLDETNTVRAAVTMPADPNQDKFIIWDDSGTAFAYVDIEECISWTIIDSDTVTAIADGKQFWAVPAKLRGMDSNKFILVDVTASVHDLNSASGGATTLVIRRVRGATAQDMTSTGVTISHDEYFASDEVVNPSYDDLATGDRIFVDVNAITSGAAHKGLSVTATFRVP